MGTDFDPGPRSSHPVSGYERPQHGTKARPCTHARRNTESHPPADHGRREGEPVNIPDQATGDDFTQRTVTPASALGAEPRPPISVHPHMVFGSGLTDPLDVLVLLHCMFAAAFGAPFTTAHILKALQDEGVRASNGSGLVGRDAVRGAFANLEKAGFIRRTQANQKGRFAAVSYELYQHPVYNPDWTPQPEPLSANVATKPQVGPQTAMPSPARPAEMPKTAGGTADGNAVAGNAVAGNAVAGGGHKTAGGTGDGNAVTDNVTPPTPPPVGGGNTSPLPSHTDPASAAEPQPKNGGGRGAPSAKNDLDPALVEAAGEFLAELPHPWACGIKTVKRLAPLLAEIAALQGWQLDADLVKALTSRSDEGVRSYPSTLKVRIEELPRRHRWAPGSSSKPVENPCPVHPSREAETCTPCLATRGDAPAVELDPQHDQAPADLEAVRAAEEALAKWRAQLGASGKSHTAEAKERKKARTRVGRQAADRKRAEEFEAERAEYLRRLEEVMAQEANAVQEPAVD
ncbi:hypothetical protein ACFVZD_46115 [Streptomyces sp. NPDC058287]|uniref:hypothetical protein n=1 Tax=Streptomyces sp. NPDC058287 TaxID=3346423 RepID=UPI0036EEBEDE